MLLALAGRMPEALLALSNAIDLAKSKPTDDSLALARAYDAIGRSLLETGEKPSGMASLRKALEEFRQNGASNGREALSITKLLKDLSSQ